jgi:DNA-binding MarR family transcriptional regulator
MAKIQDELKWKNSSDKHQVLIVDILYTANFIEDKLGPIFKSYKITNPQYNILRILKGSSPNPLSVGQIKERILFKQTDITRMIDRLESKDFVCRVLCPENRRKMDITITKGGEKLLENINPKIEELMSGILGDKISDEEASRTIELLDSLRD